MSDASPVGPTRAGLGGTEAAPPSAGFVDSRTGDPGTTRGRTEITSPIAGQSRTDVAPRTAALRHTGSGSTELGTMALVRMGVDLRRRLVHNRAQRLGRRGRRFTMLLVVLYAAGNLIGLAATRGAGDVAAERTVVLIVASLASGWLFGPILTGGVDETVDPTRLALLPLRTRQRFTIQVAGALAGIAPRAALIGLGLGFVIGLAPAGPGAVVVALAAPVTVVMVAGLARLLASGLAIAQRSRAGRDLAVLATALAAGTLFVVGQLATSMSAERAGRLIDGLAWAPWCWPARAALAARSGDTAVAVAWLAAGTVAAVAAMAAWAAASMFLLHRGERVVRTGRRGRGRVLHGAQTPFGAALARQWIYVRRSPNARVALLFGVAFGVAFPVLQLAQYGGGGSRTVALSAMLAMLTNVGATSNLLGFDAGSLWIEACCGGPGRLHMAARSLAALPNLVLPTWLSGIVVGVWTGRWDDVALVSLVAIPVALVILAQGVITSVLAPWPLPDGDNPFGNRQGAEGRGGRLAATALSGLALALVWASPIVIATAIGLGSTWVWLVPLAGLAWAAVVVWAALAWVGRHLAGNEPELLERLTPLALN